MGSPATGADRAPHRGNMAQEGGIPAGAAAGEWPFVGRDHEQRELLARLDDPSVPGAVIAGNAGVGKTRLLREVAAATAEDHHVVTAAATRAAATIPFGSLAHLMPQIPLGRDPDRFALFWAAAASIRAGANGAPVLL